MQTIANDQLEQITGGQDQAKKSESECHVKAGFDGAALQLGPLSVPLPKPYIDIGCSETQYRKR